VLAETRIEREARNPLANRLRRWGIEIGQDLLGTWIVDVEFGPIGSNRRRLRQVFLDRPAAQACLDRSLRRCATAPARFGVAYRCARSSFAARALVSKVGIDAAPAYTIIV
jgi:hypothetical protein